MNHAIQVLIVDDHAIVREGLQTLLAEIPDIAVAAEATNGADAVAKARALQPDVILMDVVMPGMDGLEAARQVRTASPRSNVVMLTSFVDERQVRAAIEAGAIGYLLKDVLKDDLVSAIRSVAEGTPTLHPEAQRLLMRQVVAPTPPSLLGTLTERERSVLELIAAGASNKAIAAQLHLTEGTVKGYVSAILAKLGVADRTQAALYAVRHGLGQES